MPMRRTVSRVVMLARMAAALTPAIFAVLVTASRIGWWVFPRVIFGLWDLAPDPKRAALTGQPQLCERRATAMQASPAKYARVKVRADHAKREARGGLGFISKRLAAGKEMECGREKGVPHLSHGWRRRWSASAGHAHGRRNRGDGWGRRRFGGCRGGGCHGCWMMSLLIVILP